MTDLAIYFNRRDLTGLQFVLRDLNLSFRENGADLIGKNCRIRCEVPNDDDSIKRNSNLHIFCARIESFDLDEGAQALVFEISKSIFGFDQRIRSLNFDLNQKKWLLRVGDDDYTDPDIYKCECTFL